MTIDPQAGLWLLRSVQAQLHGTVEPHGRLARALALLSPSVCHQVVLEAHGQEGDHSLLAAPIEPDGEPALKELHRQPWKTSAHPLEVALHTGRSVHRQVTELMLAELAHDDQHLAKLRQLDAGEIFVVPLRGVRSYLGVLVASTRLGQAFTDAERVLLELVAEQLAAYLERERIRATEVFECGLLGTFAWNRSGVILAANDTFLRMAKRSRAELVERKLLLGALLSVADGLPQPQEKALSEGELIARDNARIPVLFGVAAIDGHDVCAAGFVLDVSEQHRWTEREEMLLGIVSHDLRNPLAVISLATSMLMEEDHSPRQRKIVDRLSSASRQSMRLVSDLLDFTAARSGRIQLVRKGHDLHSIVEKTIEDLRATWPGRTVEHVRAGDGSCYVDVDRIEQIVANLIGNALQHSPRSSVVRVETRCASDALSLSVANDGEPIEPDLMPHLFAPLRRGSGAGNRPGSLGLGLFIANYFVEAHGGTIGVTSDTRNGTVFTVRLPRDSVAGSPDNRQAVLAPR